MARFITFPTKVAAEQHAATVSAKNAEFEIMYLPNDANADRHGRVWVIRCETYGQTGVLCDNGNVRV
jgi:hypothetical protein